MRRIFYGFCKLAAVKEDFASFVNNLRFQLNIVDTTLVVTRIDKLDGWNTFYHVEICFDYSQQIYLFEEFVPPQGMAYAYVMDKDTKVLDSRDINYYKYGGW